MSKKRLQLIEDASNAGYVVKETSYDSLMIYKCHKRTGTILRGVEIFYTGWALDLTVDLSVAKMFRSYEGFYETLHI